MGLFDLFKRKKVTETPSQVVHLQRHWLNDVATLSIPSDWEVTHSDKFQAKWTKKNAVLQVLSYPRLVESQFVLSHTFFNDFGRNAFSQYETLGFTSADETIVTENYTAKSFNTPQGSEYHFVTATKRDNSILITELVLKSDKPFNEEVRSVFYKIGESLFYIWDFSAEFAKKMQEKNASVEIVFVDKLEIKWKTSHSENIHLCLLENAHTDFMKHPDRQEDVMEKYVTSTLSSVDVAELQEENQAPAADTQALAKPEQILPLIKDGIFVRKLREMADVSDEILYEPLNSELFVVYAINDETTLRYLLGSDILKMGLQKSQLRELALRNLMQQIEVAIEEDTNYYRIVADGNFDVSFLLVSEVWKHENFPSITGNIRVAVPARDMLLVTDSNNPLGISEVKHLIQVTTEKGNNLISDKMFEYRNGLFMILT